MKGYRHPTRDTESSISGPGHPDKDFGKRKTDRYDLSAEESERWLEDATFRAEVRAKLRRWRFKGAVYLADAHTGEFHGEPVAWFDGTGGRQIGEVRR